MYAVLVVVDYYERRSRASALRRGGQIEVSQEEIEIDSQAAGVATALKVVGMLALGTFIIAATLFDVSKVAFVAAVGFLLTVFLGLPYWPLIVSESEREEREKVSHQAECMEASKRENR